MARRPGPLAELIHLAATAEHQPDASQPIPAATWIQLQRPAEMPWSASRLAGYQPGDTLGWRACRLEISDRQPVHLTVVRQGVLEALRWATFLAVVAAVFWWGVDRTAMIIALAALLAAAALLLPGTLATIISGALLGTLLGLAFRWVRPSPAATSASGPRPAEKSPSSVSTLTQVAIQLGWLVVLSGGALALPGLAHAAEPAMSADRHPAWPPGLTVAAAEPATAAASPADAQPAAATKPPTATNPATATRPATATKPAAPPRHATPAAAPPVYNVFIPTDKQERPTGDKYYLSEDLYDELHRRAAAVTDEPQGWLLGSAAYRGVLAWQAAPDRLTLSELRVSFELAVFGDGRGSASPCDARGPACCRTGPRWTAGSSNPSGNKKALP